MCVIMYIRIYAVSCVHYHLVQTAHDSSLVLSYGGQGSDQHLSSTKWNRKPSLFADVPGIGFNVYKCVKCDGGHFPNI